MTDEARPFAHIDTPLHALYRRVMAVFTDSKRRFVVHLRPEDVADALRGDGGASVGQSQVDDALDSLQQWGNLRATPDTSRVTTVEDFYRTRYLYQLSREGEAAERALETYEREIGRRGELQAVALEDIRIRLRALRDLGDQPDPAVVHNLLLELTGRLEGLAANATAFMGSLQRTIELQDVDEEAFLAYKDRLVSYLERFVSDLVVKANDIAGLLRGTDQARVDRLVRTAALREAADAAPDADGKSGQDPLAAKLGEWRNRWSGLWSWFVGDRVHPSQSAMLRQRARKAIPDLLATISVLQERRAGRSDRSADFRALARWFAQAPTAEDAHRLWRAAFGLSSARHLTIGAPEDEPPTASWLEVTPVPIAPRLRATGHYQRRGSPSRVLDRSVERAELARQMDTERRQTDAARRRLATGRATRLADLGVLDADEFALFLRLLGDALAAGPPDPDGLIRARTTDGSIEVVLRALPGAAPAEIRTPDGVLRGPDHELVITDLTRPSTAAAQPQRQPVR